MKTDAEVLVEQIMVYGVSVFYCYRDLVLDDCEWYAVDEPMSFDYGYSGACGVGSDPVAAVRDMLAKKGLPCG